ncbi:MAG: SIR2 family NAD-dependent protein deacylase [Promethearchaeota archaeon]
MFRKPKIDAFNQAADWIIHSRHVVAFTGAGISVESGIPTFRGEDGLWAKYDPVFLYTDYFIANPRKSWELIKEIFYDFFGKAEPNTAHRILADWEKKGMIKTIITQNIDSLHQKAGSKNVLEYHGTARTLTCMSCHEKFSADELLDELPPRCPECGGLLKPDFVFFTEPIPSDVQRLSMENAAKADLFILVGTTGEIMPASMIPNIARESGSKIIEINIEPSRYTNTITDIFLKGKATTTFEMLDKLIVARDEK